MSLLMLRGSFDLVEFAPSLLDVLVFFLSSLNWQLML